MSGAVPEGQTMNTDQRLAVLLTDTLAKTDAERNRLRRLIEAGTEAPLSELLRRQQAHINAMGDRLHEIIQALAGGTLIIEGAS